jgi:hypothetical protein
MPITPTHTFSKMPLNGCTGCLLETPAAAPSK